MSRAGRAYAGFWMVAGITAVHPLLRFSWDNWAQTLVHLFAAACAPVLLFGSGGRWRPAPAACVIAAAWCAASALSALFSPLQSAVLPALLNEWTAAWFFLAATGFGTERERLIAAAWTPALLLSLASLAHFALHGWEHTAEWLVNPNVAAGLSILAWPLARAGSSRRSLAAAPMLLVLAASRSFSGVVVAAAQAAALSTRRLRIFLAALLAMGLFAVVYAPPAGLARSLSDRFVWWTAAARMSLERPFPGWGPGTFGEAFPGFRPSGSQAPNSMYAHNAVLETAAELGWPALGVLAWLVAASLRQAGGSARARPLIVACAGFAAFSLLHFSASIPSAKWLWFLLLGLCWPQGASAPGRAASFAGCAIAAAVAAASSAAFLADRASAQALAAARAGDHAGAQRHAGFSLLLNPRAAAPHYALGLAALSAGDWTKAAEQLERAAELSPFLPDHHEALAMAHQGARRPEAELRARERAAQLNPVSDRLAAALAEAKARLASGEPK